MDAQAGLHLCCSQTPEDSFSCAEVHTKLYFVCKYSKTCLKRPLKNRQNKCLKDRLSLNEGQKYGAFSNTLEHSAILLTCIRRSLVLKTNFSLLFEWLLKTGFTVFLYFCFLFYTGLCLVCIFKIYTYNLFLIFILELCLS